MKQLSIYLAGPFFTPEQVVRLASIEALCSEFGILCYSPRKFKVLKPDASEYDKTSVFKDNIDSIKSATVVLACIDVKDTGTIWEMGYAFGTGIPVVTFTLTGQKMNVMLANSCVGFLESFEDVKRFLKGHPTQYHEIEATGYWFQFNWDIAKKWKKEV